MKMLRSPETPSSARTSWTCCSCLQISSRAVGNVRKFTAADCSHATGIKLAPSFRFMVLSENNDSQRALSIGIRVVTCKLSTHWLILRCKSCNSILGLTVSALGLIYSKYARLHKSVVLKVSAAFGSIWSLAGQYDGDYDDFQSWLCIRLWDIQTPPGFSCVLPTQDRDVWGVASQSFHTHSQQDWRNAGVWQ